ncbi:hypothetical protein TRP8649_01236 [Pelagimonas phthalicica]|uniref:Uncharacterized protein n=1 Tax=Pelagimonas phthalicica TaxID=1037362 RepID=A0A238JA99_9RHOB|nr:hypothetical protein [Pelagimonas phthalicica]TDS94339.1 hypothetical protein CLV87_0836 [Pelagimonas phthalicica]SMX27134.1 hypothetical protein TRP8649_01236 [Pelagimonas phthalicica]
MRNILVISALAAMVVGALPSPASANTRAIEAEQRKILTACQDRLFGVPPQGAETFMETTYNQGHPIVRVVPGGIVNEWQARDINSCAARTLGFQGPLASSTYGCPVGYRGMYRGTLYCR